MHVYSSLLCTPMQESYWKIRDFIKNASLFSEMLTI